MPEFGGEADVESTSQEQEEVTAGEETPSEAATENEPDGETTENETPADDVGTQTKELQNEIIGLRTAREDLIKELKDLRGERREIKQRELDRVDDKIEQAVDDLKDVHPDDTKLIERVLRAKGYVSQGEVNKMLFNAKKQEVISSFLHEFPEYNPDANPDKWESLKQEISLYREPATAEQYGVLLRRAHKMVNVASPSGPSVAVKKHQASVASAGSGGARKPSQPHRLSQLAEQHLQGFTQEEIREMQKRLSNR